jgi:ABC-type nitrate/sulfonate/bicarbonate transport system substrate-binding protein
MRNIDKISFPYRAQTHLTLLHVVAESGAWAKHGLEVDYNFQISMSDAHRAVTNGEVEFIGGNHISTATAEGKETKCDTLWRWVQNGKVDAAFLRAPAHLFAADAGLKIIDIEPLPMIWYTTISSSLPFIEQHPDIVERFLKGMIEGIHFFKTQPESSIEIIRERYTNEGRLDHAQATYVYQNLAPLLEPKLYPTIAAIANVYEEAKRLDADASRVNPMELWDLHHIRRLDDIGFVDGLYGSQKSDACSAQDQKDPEYLRDQQRRWAAVVATVKASGESESGDCH